MKRSSAVFALLLVSGFVLGIHHEGKDLAAQLTGGSRAAEDPARDAGRKPAQVIAFLGIERGMTVVDLIAAGGYYTEVLSLPVGPKGRVYAQNGARRGSP